MEKFLGVPYPIRKHPNGLLHTQSGINQIKSDLLVLLLTSPKERVMDPEYGTPLKQLLFDPADPVLREKTKTIIANSLAAREPRVTIEQIEVTTNFDREELNQDDTMDDIEHILGIKILFYDPENISEIQELKLEIPLGGF